jgi:hypothetical protein
VSVLHCLAVHLRNNITHPLTDQDGEVAVAGTAQSRYSSVSYVSRQSVDGNLRPRPGPDRRPPHHRLLRSRSSASLRRPVQRLFCSKWTSRTLIQISEIRETSPQKRLGELRRGVRTIVFPIRPIDRDHDDGTRSAAPGRLPVGKVLDQTSTLLQRPTSSPRADYVRGNTSWTAPLDLTSSRSNPGPTPPP